MFIGQTIDLKDCAPAERDVSEVGGQTHFRFRSAGARKNLLTLRIL